MGVTERRKELMRILCRRRHETIRNLAREFRVSERTIMRDVESLSLSEPIYTQCGRYTGGVYVVDGYSMDRMYMTEQELQVLHKLAALLDTSAKDVLTEEEQILFKKIISLYTKPAVRKENQ